MKHSRTKSAAAVEIYERESYQPRNGVGYLINRVRSELLAALDRELAAAEELRSLEISSAQMIIVAMLASAEGSISASELCKGISYDAGAMTRMIDRLESKGLIQRKRCTDDRRLVYLQLTEAGTAAYPRMREISRRVLNRFLRGFSRAELNAFEGYLHRMLENA